MKTSVMAQLLVSAGPSFFPGGRTGFRIGGEARRPRVNRRPARRNGSEVQRPRRFGQRGAAVFRPTGSNRSEEHTSELQSLMRNSYAVFCLKKKNKNTKTVHDHNNN